MTALDDLLERALTAPYHRVFIREDDGGYSASVLELEGCSEPGRPPMKRPGRWKKRWPTGSRSSSSAATRFPNLSTTKRTQDGWGLRLP